MMGFTEILIIIPVVFFSLVLLVIPIIILVLVFQTYAKVKKIEEILNREHN